jgi:hypothetical protein
MAKIFTPFYPKNLIDPTCRIQNSDSTNFVTFMTAGADGSILDMITVSTTESANSRTLQLYRSIGGVDYLIATYNIAANSGVGVNQPAVNILNNANFPATAYDSSGNKILKLAPNTSLKVKLLSAVAASNFIAVCGTGFDY